MKDFRFFCGTEILFGAGKLNELGNMKLPGKKALLVTTSGRSVEKYGYLRRVEDLLTRQGISYVLYRKVVPNPTVSIVSEGARIAIEESCDFIIALGGGSPIDTSKMIALMAKNPGTIWDYITNGTGGRKAPSSPGLPVVAINTTSGTGSEVNPWAVVTNEETGEKIGWGNDDSFAIIAIEDPELTCSIPPMLTASQGMDAFYHLAECFLAATDSDFDALFALKGIELLNTWLPKAVKDGSDLEARTQVMYASMLGGFTQFISDTISLHAMQHAMGGTHPSLTHGIGLILLADAYFQFYADKPGYAEKYARMAQAMGVDISQMSSKEKSQAFIEAHRKLLNACNVGNLHAADFGFDANEAETLARLSRKIKPKAFTDSSCGDLYSTSEMETTQIFNQVLRE